MTKQMMDAFIHPVRSRILLELTINGEMTALELKDALGDIPQATLYRHLNAMVADNVIFVLAERKKRAMMEKVYACRQDMAGDLPELLRQNRGDVYMQQFMLYIMAFMKEFYTYTTREDIDILRDGSGFSMAPIYTTDEELVELVTVISKLTEPYRQNKLKEGDDKKFRTLGLIIAPPKHDSE